MQDLFQIGVITNTHGVRGEVKVFPTTEDPKRFEMLKEISLYKNDKFIETLKIEKVRYVKQFVLLKFKGVDSINDVEKYKNYSIQVTRDEALPLENNEFYVQDLIGLEVFTEDNKKFGDIKDIIFTGSNDVYVIQTEEKEVLVPAIKECILNIDLEKNVMIVHLMEGLV